MKKTISLAVCLVFLIGVSSCGADSKNEDYKEEIIEMEDLQHEMDEVSDALESETEDMNHDIDSLLEGI
ncbi:MAG: hypothetical protein COA58_05460 [Bacteroidetes bacterium]|nr:MAG: hypothetical protein COA58_05460 [Bacteroidota bacterium]